MNRNYSIKKDKNYRIKTKDNGDIYNFDPIVGYNVPLYKSEFAEVQYLKINLLIND